MLKKSVVDLKKTYAKFPAIVADSQPIKIAYAHDRQIVRFEIDENKDGKIDRVNRLENFTSIKQQP